MLDKIITTLVMKWCKKQLNKLGNDILVINGTGKDYPDYLLFTDSEKVREQMMCI